jgi:cytochrome oxidase Cu insertion factor (SCO1/SenC/PrrC family)
VHICGALFFVATLSSITLLPGITRDVHAHVPLPFAGAAMNDAEHDVLVVFAGFPGCNDVCPTTLAYLDRAHRKLGDTRVGIAFLNVLIETPPQVSDAYAKSFNSAFFGYTVAPEERAAVYRQMGLQADERPERVAEHKASLFIYTRKGAGWALRRVLTTPPSMESFVAQVVDLAGDVRRS